MFPMGGVVMLPPVTGLGGGVAIGTVGSVGIIPEGMAVDGGDVTNGPVVFEVGPSV